MANHTMPLFGDQGRLEPKARARRADPATSHQAARQVNESGKALVNRERILALLKERRDQWLTAGQIAASLPGLDHVEVCRRLPELKERGDVEVGEAVPCPVRGNKMRGWRYVRG